jgi:DNA primase
MSHDLERLKQRISLLEYLQRHNWRPCRTGSRQELVGLCPLHQETRPSFYVNAAKNLFHCHACGRGADLIRFVQLFLDLPFRKTVAHLVPSRPPHQQRHRGPLSGGDGLHLASQREDS